MAVAVTKKEWNGKHEKWRNDCVDAFPSWSLRKENEGVIQEMSGFLGEMVGIYF